MIAPIVHAWERSRARADRSRQALPFAWGTEYLGDLLPRGAEADPRSALLGLARRAVERPETFHVDPGAPPDVERQGDRIAFPSAVRAPEPATNLASARIFEPRRRTGRAVVVLPQWNADPESHVGLCRVLARRGVTAVRLTLPYHEDRRPAGAPRADHAVSANLGRTLLAARQAVSDARRSRAWLEREGYDRIGLVGTSLGSCIAFLTLAMDPGFRTAVLHHVSSHFGEVVWRGISTRHVREELELHVSRTLVRRLWGPISPIHFVRRLSPRSHSLLLIGRYDLTFPLAYSRRLARAYRQNDRPHRVVVLPWGHYGSGVFPFSAILVGRVIRYLDARL